MARTKDTALAPFGEVVAAVFEEAQRLTTDPTRAAALAAAALRRILLRTGDARVARLLSDGTPA